MYYKLHELCLEVTNACPMECLHCSTCSVHTGNGTSFHMPVSIVKNIISDFIKLGGSILEISGGEPLLYPHLDELCRYAASLNLEIRLYTSGVQYNSHDGIAGLTKQRVQELKNNGVSKIIFNLEGANAEVHEKITAVDGSHRLVLKGIKNAKEAGLWTGVHFVPMKPNARELPNVAKLCSQLGVDELAILRFVPQGRGKENRSLLELTPNEFKKLLRRIISLKVEHPALNIRAGCPMDFLSLFDKRIKPHKCKAGINTCSITPSGDVLPCPGFKNSTEYLAGNVYKKTLSEIWNNGFYDLRNFDYKKIRGQCSTCEDFDSCLGRCAAQRHIVNGDIYQGPDPACPKKEKLGEIIKPKRTLLLPEFSDEIRDSSL
jgi:radical SAM protein with 4Fe4S-binding SPASM domain